MKRNVIALLIFSAVVFSCSKDKNNNNDNESTIVGTWQATELKIDNNTASDDAKNSRDILDYLTANDCYVITFTFNADLSVISDNAVNYLEINAGPTGIEIPCPTESDTDAGTYTVEGSTLTYIDSNDDTFTISISINGDTMTLDASSLDIPNFEVEGELVFKRK